MRRHVSNIRNTHSLHGGESDSQLRNGSSRSISFPPVARTASTAAEIEAAPRILDTACRRGEPRRPRLFHLCPHRSFAHSHRSVAHRPPGVARIVFFRRRGTPSQRVAQELRWFDRLARQLEPAFLRATNFEKALQDAYDDWDPVDGIVPRFATPSISSAWPLTPLLAIRCALMCTCHGRMIGVVDRLEPKPARSSTCPATHAVLRGGRTHHRPRSRSCGPRRRPSSRCRSGNHFFDGHWRHSPNVFAFWNEMFAVSECVG